MNWYRVFALFSVFISAKGEKRVAGGDVVPLDSYPFAVALLKSTNGEFEQVCGGTIITNKAILSAASCFYTNGIADSPSEWRARIGSQFADSGGTIHFIRGISLHPDYQPPLNDVAVLHVTVPMTYRDGAVAAARLAGATYTLETNQPVWGIGWGDTAEDGERSRELRAVQFWVVNQSWCENRYRELGITIAESMVCAGWLDVGIRGQCEGDVGSPLLDNGVVVGIHSRSEGCADPWFPGVNTRVMPYLRWIVDTALADEVLT